jgi:hypothetical protein
MLADAVDADQSTLFEVGFQLVLAGLVFFGVQVLTERVPGGDEGSALSSGQGWPMCITNGASWCTM